MNDTLDWLDREGRRMTSLVEAWAEIPSETRDLEGLARMIAALETAFKPIADAVERVPIAPAWVLDDSGTFHAQPLGQVLHVTRRAGSSRRILLVIHVDTVHPRERAPRLERTGDGRLFGPGVADAKGGLAVLLLALEALERSGLAASVGWEAILNSDEEIGSPGSGDLLRRAAKRSDVGLVFEPALPDGSLAGERKGSARYEVVVRGRSAHVGRDFAAGRNAITTLCRIVDRMDRGSGAIVNVGRIAGGGALNVVPDLAIARWNLRFDEDDEARAFERELRRVARSVAERHGTTSEVHATVTAPPKRLDSATTALLEAAADCGRELGLAIDWRSTGGVSDGSRLAAAGLPTIDTLGPRGDGIHTPQEHVFLESLPERAKLTALLLLRLAKDEIPWGRPSKPSPAEVRA